MIEKVVTKVIKKGCSYIIFLWIISNWWPRKTHWISL